MKKFDYRVLGVTAVLFSSALVMAQEEEGKGFTISGSLQTDILFPEEDEAIGTGTYNDDCLSNTYLDLNLRSKYVDAGARVEYMRSPMPGFESGFAGQGLPHFYLTGKYKGVELTVGDFYEQFGSGLVLRTYEERSLGIDNSIRGGRLKFQPYKGIRVRMLGGNQRYYWERSEGYVYGADVELSIDQWSRRMQDNAWFLTLGGSYVGKFEKADDDRIFPNPTDMSQILNLPEKVNSFDVRANLQKGNYSFLAEYAMKSYDPSAENGYIYKKGSALLLSGSYSKRGMSLLLQAKRSDDMQYRSQRSVTGTALSINNLPAFAYQHTYALAALYPYATQPDGEWAYQAELRYNFKRGTALGGKYGTDIRLNFSHVRSIGRTPLLNPWGQTMGADGYSSKFFKQGDLYYQDLHIDIAKKFNRSFKGNLMYMWQKYNQEVVEGHAVNGTIVNSHIFVAEGKYTINRRLTLRMELQYLHTKQDEGDWGYALAEFTVLPYLMFTVSDMYNFGATDQHYYLGMVTFNHKAHRLAVSYGRTRAGYNCSGGVCRYVPASKGFQISYNLVF